MWRELHYLRIPKHGLALVDAFSNHSVVHPELDAPYCSVLGIDRIVKPVHRRPADVYVAFGIDVERRASESVAAIPRDGVVGIILDNIVAGSVGICREQEVLFEHVALEIKHNEGCPQRISEIQAAYRIVGPVGDKRVEVIGIIVFGGQKNIHQTGKRRVAHLFDVQRIM